MFLNFVSGKQINTNVGSAGRMRNEEDRWLMIELFAPTSKLLVRFIFHLIFHLIRLSADDA
jgi:hypothetical protein